jgi:hypothetical protein
MSLKSAARQLAVKHLAISSRYVQTKGVAIGGHHPSFHGESAKSLGIRVVNACVTEGGALAVASIAVLLVVLPAALHPCPSSSRSDQSKADPASNYDALAADLATSC